MPLDAVLVQETRAWFVRAAADLRASHLVLAAEPPLLEHAVFGAQQAVEKSIKGFLLFHGKIFRRTHAIEELGEQVLAIDKGFESMIERAVPLTEYAWRFRYPGDPASPSREEAESALAVARDLHNGLLARLPSEVVP